MRQRVTFRTGLIFTTSMLLGACASTSDIDPGDLPPEATVDDGIDYYSADLGADELLGHGDDQWTDDENGNRVYLLNRIRRGQSATYYVGDIRYLYAGDYSDSSRATGYGNAPVYVSRGGAPLQSPTFRGGRDNTYYQTRRGRIVYLPNAHSAPAVQPQATPSTQAPVPAAPTTSAPPPRPSVSAPPRPAPRTAAPRSQQQPRSRTGDRVRRPDR